jgi:galactokinase
VALVERGASGEFARDVAAAYEARTGLVPSIHVCEAAAGASVEAT